MQIHILIYIIKGLDQVQAFVNFQLLWTSVTIYKILKF